MTNPYLSHMPPIGTNAPTPAPQATPMPAAPQPWSPTSMVTSQGPARGIQMERMARPSRARRAMKMAKATGNLPRPK